MLIGEAPLQWDKQAPSSFIREVPSRRNGLQGHEEVPHTQFIAKLYFVIGNMHV